MYLLPAVNRPKSSVREGVLTLTEERYERALADVRAAPELLVYRGLIMSSAERHGEQAVEVWRTLRGHWFGSRTVMTNEAAARTLKLPVSQVNAIVTSVLNDIRPEWQASDAYARLAKRQQAAFAAARTTST